MGEPAISQAAAAALIAEHLTRYRTNLPVLGQSKGMSFGGGIWGDYSTETGTNEEVGTVKSRRVTWAYGAGPAWMGTTDAPWEPVTGVGFFSELESVPGRSIWCQFFDNHGPFPDHDPERLSAIFVIDGRQDYAATFPLIPGGAGKSRTATVDVSGAFLNFMFADLAGKIPSLDGGIGLPLTLPYLQSLYRRSPDYTYQSVAPEYGNAAYFVPPHMPDYYPALWMPPPGTSSLGGVIQQWFDGALVSVKAVPIAGGRGYRPDTTSMWAYSKRVIDSGGRAFFTTYVPPKDIGATFFTVFALAAGAILTGGAALVGGAIATAVGTAAAAAVKAGASSAGASISPDQAAKLDPQKAKALVASTIALQASVKLAMRFPVGSSYSDTPAAARGLLGGIDPELLVAGAVAAKAGGLL